MSRDPIFDAAVARLVNGELVEALPLEDVDFGSASLKRWAGAVRRFEFSIARRRNRGTRG